MRVGAVIRCECGFEARAADEEGLVAEVRRHAATDPLHVALARRGAAARLPRRAGSAAHHPSRDDQPSRRGGEVKRRLFLLATLALVGVVAFEAGSVAPARELKPAPAAPAEAVLAWNTNAVNAMRASSPSKAQVEGLIMNPTTPKRLAAMGASLAALPVSTPRSSPACSTRARPRPRRSLPHRRTPAAGCSGFARTQPRAPSSVEPPASTPRRLSASGRCATWPR